MTTESDCIKTNETLAGFIGLKKGDTWQVWNGRADYSDHKCLDFNTDWNLIMRVVAKINEIASKEELSSGCALMFEYIKGAVISADIDTTLWRCEMFVQYYQELG